MIGSDRAGILISRQIEQDAPRGSRPSRHTTKRDLSIQTFLWVYMCNAYAKIELLQQSNRGQSTCSRPLGMVLSSHFPVHRQQNAIISTRTFNVVKIDDFVHCRFASFTQFTWRADHDLCVRHLIHDLDCRFLLLAVSLA